MTVLRSALCGQYSLWQTWKEANTVLVLLQKPLTTVQAITRTNCGSDGSPTYQTRTLAGLCTSWIKSIGSRSDVKSWNSVLSQDSLEAVFFVALVLVMLWWPCSWSCGLVQYKTVIVKTWLSTGYQWNNECSTNYAWLCTPSTSAYSVVHHRTRGYI